jgi:hypothetical protein
MIPGVYRKFGVRGFMGISARAGLASLLLVSTASAADHVMLNANFNNQTVGAPPLARGAAYGEPISVGTVVVSQSPLATPHLQLIDNSTCCASSTWFEFLNGEERTTGTVQVRANVLLTGQGQPIIFRLGERGGFAQSYLQLYTGVNSTLVYAQPGSPNFGTAAILPANTVLAIEANVSVEHRKASVRINGEPLGGEWDIPVNTDRGIGRLYVGTLNNAVTADDAMRIDDIRVVACDAPVFAECIFLSGFED